MELPVGYHWEIINGRPIGVRDAPPPPAQPLYPNLNVPPFVHIHMPPPQTNNR